MKISVIMPSFLGEYEGAAIGRKDKFKRAVTSFLTQTYENRELIIVSDGCAITEKMFKSEFSKFSHLIKLVSEPKSDQFSGHPRNVGVKEASGDIICYLDTDDYMEPHHLKNIVDFIPKDSDWVFFNDYAHLGHEVSARIIEVEKDSIGTSSIAHWSKTPVTWPDGYGHDWKMIESCLKDLPHAKIYGCGYVVCHVVGVFDR